MEKANQKDILVLITNPFATINIVHSGLMGKLCECYRVAVMSDLLTGADVDQLNRHFHLNMHLLKTPVPTLARYVNWLRAFQTLLFGYYFGLETIRIKLMERCPAYARLFSLFRKNRALTFLSGYLLVFIRNALIHRTKLPTICPSLAAHRFRAVISTSPFDLRENAVSNSFIAYGIPCISLIISWDNLTSKGVINVKSGLVLVWNKTMALEYQRFYELFGDRTAVHIAGIPRFDIYFKNKDPRFGTKPDINLQTILFSTGAVKHHSCQNYIIEDLLEYAKARPTVRILVRCHPGDDPSRYTHFDGVKNLRFFQPFGQNTTRVPPVDFLETLHLQLAGCDVCVQIASTMLLDAAACRKPCISIAYDGPPVTHYAASVRRFYDYSHQLSIRNLVEKQLVHDRRELFGKLDEILGKSDASNDSNDDLMHYYGPGSVRLTSEYIREWLG